jgi:hypothetical protein
MRSYTRQQIEKTVKSKNWVWFEDRENKSLDLNIVGIRSSQTGKKVTNVFDDVLTVSYKQKGLWVFKQWLITCDPGTRGVMRFENPNGVARLVSNQYRSSHRLGLHRGKYLALTQQNPVKVFRDANRDMIYDERLIQEGLFGINIHKAGANTTWVEDWSEGCQVFKRSKDFDEFMKLCQDASIIHGTSFTYTLLESKDII